MAFLDDALSTLSSVADVAAKGVNIYQALQGTAPAHVVQTPPPPAGPSMGQVLTIVGVGLAVIFGGLIAFKFIVR